MAQKVNRVRLNPLDFSLKELGLTRAEFGRQVDLGKQYLLRVSQGRHSQIGEYTQQEIYRIAEKKGVDIDKLVKDQYGVKPLQKAWDRWVTEHRKAQTLPNPGKEGANAFDRLVKAVGGVARMSALLAVSDPLVERYAKGVTKNMPGPIRTALEEMGYKHTNDLDKAMLGGA